MNELKVFFSVFCNTLSLFLVRVLKSWNCKTRREGKVFLWEEILAEDFYNQICKNKFRESKNFFLFFQ